jgi:hypothetical protein
MHPQLILLAFRLAHQRGVAESVTHLRTTAHGLHGTAGDRRKRNALNAAANELDERIGRAEQRSRDQARTANPRPPLQLVAPSLSHTKESSR